MGIPLDGDWNNLPAKIESEMTDAGKADWGNKPRAAKGGVFSTADIPLIKRALNAYRDKLIATEDSEREPSAELTQLAHLMHRLNNRI